MKFTHIKTTVVDKKSMG